MRQAALALLAVGFLAGAAVALEGQGEAVRPLIARAQEIGEPSQDQALAALYNRLFQLQDKRRDAELRIDAADLAVEDLAKAYSKEDRSRIEAAELKEIASDPDHPRYPNITESRKLELLAEVRKQLRLSRLAELEIKKLERDIAEVNKLIQEHLARRRVP